MLPPIVPLCINVDIGIGVVGVGTATPVGWLCAQSGDSPGIVGLPAVVRRGIIGVALEGRQWQAKAVGRESGRGSGGHTTMLSGWQQHNAHTGALLGLEGGNGHAAVLAGQQQGQWREGMMEVVGVMLRCWGSSSVVGA